MGWWNFKVVGTARTSLLINNVDNTSDANKPVSTAQAAADTNTLILQDIRRWISSGFMG
jgi:hypothetical protein